MPMGIDLFRQNLRPTAASCKSATYEARPGDDCGAASAEGRVDIMKDRRLERQIEGFDSRRGEVLAILASYSLAS